MAERVKELAEEAEWEKALKDVTTTIAKEQGKAAKAAEEKAQSLEKAWLTTEKKLAEVEEKLGETELKLAKATSPNLAQANAMADLKATFETCEDKWYNEGFTDAENTVEPVVHKARVHGFREGWLATLQAMGMPDDSPLRNPEKIPYPAPTPPV